jgi:hypothetical protein
VTVQRGRWWPDGVPLALSGAVTTHPNGMFEPFDLIQGVGAPSWQAAHQGQPEHLVANAIYIEIRHVFHFPVLKMMASLSTILEERVYAFDRGIADDRVCAAPFAVPVCALLDTGGEFVNGSECRHERYFTALDRYCDGGGDPTCNRLPGTLWTPVMDEDDQHFDGLPWGWGYPLYQRQQCSWETYPRAEYVGDHFGVVGLPAPAATSLPLDEMEIRAVIGGEGYPPQSDGCALAKIGDQFLPLAEGLRAPDTDNTVWTRITDTSHAPLFHPEMIESVMRGGVATNRIAVEVLSAPLPSPDNSIDPLTMAGKINCTTYVPQFSDAALCRSRYLMASADCFKRELTNFYFDCDPWGMGDWFMKMQGVRGCPASAPGSLIADGRYFLPDAWGLGTADYIGRAVFDSGLAAPGAVPAEQRARPVWQVPIPVIASLGDVAAGVPAASCTGVLGNLADDPPVRASEKYVIVGFIEAVFYDTDIGPGYAGQPAVPAEGDMDMCGDGLLRTALGNPRRLPHSFKQNTGRDCNVVKGITECGAKLLPTQGSFRVSDVRQVRLRGRED